MTTQMIIRVDEDLREQSTHLEKQGGKSLQVASNK